MGNAVGSKGIAKYEWSKNPKGLRHQFSAKGALLVIGTNQMCCGWLLG